MSHFKIAVGVFLTILFGSVIIHGACEKNLNVLRAYAVTFSQMEECDDKYRQKLDKMEIFYKDKKDTLQLLISKEHIRDIQLNIALMKNGMEYQNADDCRRCAVEILSDINTIKEYISVVD